MTTIYRFLTGTDDSVFCHKISRALSEGWVLHGQTHYVANPVTGQMQCGQAVLKETDEKYDPERKLGDY